MQAKDAKFFFNVFFEPSVLINSVGDVGFVQHLGDGTIAHTPP